MSEVHLQIQCKITTEHLILNQWSPVKGYERMALDLEAQAIRYLETFRFMHPKSEYRLVRVTTEVIK